MQASESTRKTGSQDGTEVRRVTHTVSRKPGDRLAHFKRIIAVKGKSPTFWLLVCLVLLALAFCIVGFGRGGDILDFLHLTNEELPEHTALTFIGAAMGGALLALNAVASHNRAQAMQEAAKAQADGTREQAAANDQIEHGRRQERFKNAIEHLGHESAAVRLGGRYELYNLARETEELRQTVLDILCTHIRQATSAADYRDQYETKPSFEIQDLLTLAFVREPDVFAGLGVDLEGSWLNGAELERARLWNANLRRAHLCHAKLHDAHLERADLSMADLRCAQLVSASLREADLLQAQMGGCHLGEAKLQGANLRGAELTNAWLGNAHLHGANLDGAKMYGAHLGHANMQATCVSDLALQGAELGGSTWRGAERSVPWLYPNDFADRIRRLTDTPSDLGGVAFAGGMTDRQVSELMDEMICNVHADLRDELRKGLEEHIGLNAEWGRLPSGNTVITGSYAEPVATEWIAEHEKAMGNVPEAKGTVRER